MEQENKNIIPELHLFPRLEKVCRFIGGFFVMHQLSTVSEHSHPLDQELEEEDMQGRLWNE